MLLGSWLLMRVRVGERLLASFQNLSAGLVLAAVASELFPMLAASPTNSSLGGLTVGFVCGLLVVFGVEKLGDFLEEVRRVASQRHLDMAPALVSAAR